MKNIIITLASVATLAGAANAQTATYQALRNIAGAWSATGYDATTGSETGPAIPFNIGGDAAGILKQTWAGLAHDGTNFQALREIGGSWTATGYDATTGSQTGPAIIFNFAGDAGVIGKQTWAGLAHDGTNFHALRKLGGKWSATQYDGITGTEIGNVVTFNIGGDAASLGGQAWAGLHFDGTNYVALRKLGGEWRATGYDGVTGAETGPSTTFNFGGDAAIIGEQAWSGLTAIPVPEPSSTALLGLGALGLLARRKR